MAWCTGNVCRCSGNENTVMVVLERHKCDGCYGNTKTVMGVLELWLGVPDIWASVLDTQKN